MHFTYHHSSLFFLSFLSYRGIFTSSSFLSEAEHSIFSTGYGH